MKRLLFLSMLCAATIVATASIGSNRRLPALIPYPQQLEITGAHKMPLLNVKVKIDTTLDLPAEGYTLESYRRGVRITAKDERGAVWARQTLRQLTDSKGLIPSIKITDWPAFAIRGFMHDVGRNFISIDVLKEHLDILSQYKVNMFHWHLTDYPAWRIESRAFPQLNDPQYQRKGRDEGKFYTYGEIRDVIKYARKKGIMVIPEIDIPGHSTYFNSTFGFGMADPRGMEILETAFNEFFAEISVSDAPYMHIGSDEIHISNPKEFMQWADSLVKANNRIPMIWDPGLPASEGTIRQIWRDVDVTESDLNLKGQYLDSFMGYLNGSNPIIFGSRMFLHNPCGKAQGDSMALGGTLCLWNDTRVADKVNIIRHSSAWSGLLPFAERFWHGGLTAEGVTSKHLYPNPETPAGKSLAVFEERMLEHKNGQLRDEPFYWIPNASQKWRVSEPTAFGADTSSLKWHTLYGGSIEVDTYLSALKLPNVDSGEVWAEMIITVPRDTVILAQIGFDAPARSNRIGVGIGKQGEWEGGGRVWVNGTSVEPPVWNEPGAYNYNFHTWHTIESELPYTDEQLFWTREPSEIKLKAGENRVTLCVRKTFPNQPWVFAFVPHVD